MHILVGTHTFFLAVDKAGIYIDLRTYVEERYLCGATKV